MSLLDTKIGEIKNLYPVTLVQMRLFRNNWNKDDEFYWDYFHFSLLQKWNLL